MDWQKPWKALQGEVLLTFGFKSLREVNAAGKALEMGTASAHPWTIVPHTCKMILGSSRR